MVRNSLALAVSGMILITALTLTACTAKTTNQPEARRLIMGTVYTYMAEVKDTDLPSLEEYAGEHSTSEQRRFNLLCMAYGSDPELFEDVAVWGGLPQFRMDVCEEEYELIELAIHTLIGPHLDPDLAEKVLDKNWLLENTSRTLIENKKNKDSFSTKSNLHRE